MDFSLPTILITLGQLLIGGLYVFAGLNHFGPVSEKIIPVLAARGVPQPRMALYVASALEILAGACLMMGVAVVPAALGLALFTVLASYVMTNFWDMPPGEAREALHNVCISNLAIVGGLLLAAAQAL
ncbi:MAG TPA: DoxX family protein [Hyphomicrobium sp.]|nr:DoxX family protein [Hyphomicrobium sp.]